MEKILSAITRVEQDVAHSKLTLNKISQQLILIKEAVNEFQTSATPKRLYTTSTDQTDLIDQQPNVKKSKHSYSMNDDHVVVYTDGACSDNGKHGAKAGIGVWFGPDHPLNVSMPCPSKPTNNNAEILACAEACKVAQANGIDKLEIRTDSQFVINCMTKWIFGWKKNNWKTSTGHEAKNKEQLIILENQVNLMTSVKYVYVKGHAGIAGNEGADELAVRGTNM